MASAHPGSPGDGEQGLEPRTEETPAQPTQPLPLAEPAQGFGGQRRVRSTLRGWRLLAEKSIAQRESCEVRFTWGEKRPTAQETASQRAPRNCSQEVGGGQYRCDFGEGGEGGVHAVKHFFFAEVSASHEEQTSPWILVLF